MNQEKLAVYKRKRRFNRTPEPEGEVGRSEGNRFSIQEHHARRLHYDLRLEMDGVLKSWAMPKGLPQSENARHLAVMTEDHPIDYLDFEGIIPHGNYGAGRVVLWEIGRYRKVSGSLEEGKFKFTISGRSHYGQYTLVKTSLEGGKNTWLIMKTGTFSFPQGADPVPPLFVPMRAVPGDAPFTDSGWLYEPKWDGVRALSKMVRSDGALKVDLWGRNLKPFEIQYPEVVEALHRLSAARPEIDQLILDGEIVAYDKKGAVSFQALQHRMHLSQKAEVEAIRRTIPVQYLLFDLLFINGVSLMNSPYRYRRALLSNLGLPVNGGGPKAAPKETLQVSLAVEDGIHLFEALRRRKGEGIVAKRKESFYFPGRRGSDWIKIKMVQEQECVVAGWTEGKGNRSGSLGALLLGLYDGARLVYIGHTGSGFDGKEVERAKARLAEIETGRCPFEERPKTNARPHWVDPSLVAQIKFSNWTEERRLRAPVFLGFREDVSPEECRFEEVVETGRVVGRLQPKKEAVWIGDRVVTRFEGRPIEVSHLDKVFWPERGYTKAHLIDYYIKAAPYLLPHLVHRPLTLIRFPNGIDGESFYQKDWKEDLPPWVKHVTVRPGSKEEKRSMIVCENPSTLVWLSNLANIELHPWYSRVDAGDAKIDRPDFVVFDIDPPKSDAPGRVDWERFEQAAEAALRLKKVLDEQGLACYLKTTGKSGLHLFVPIVRKYSHAQTREFARVIAERLRSDHAAQITTVWQKEKRGKKVLVDINQNARGKTLASIYSLRAVPEATVSTPIAWEELPGIRPTDFTLETLPERLEKRGDLWDGILGAAQDPLRLKK